MQAALKVFVLAALATVDAAAPRLSPGEHPPAAPFDEAAAIAALETRIAGKEGQPAKTVFDNVEVLGEMPAGRLLRIMELGYSRSLGVSCNHCHVAGDWASDANAHKRIARQMAVMTRDLNEKVLPAIAELKDEGPTVNCTTCHRGEEKPALSLEGP